MDKKVLNVNDLYLPEWRGRISEVFKMVQEIDITSMSPIMVDSNNLILDGKKRYLACIYHGVDIIPVIVRSSSGKIYSDRKISLS